MTPITPISPIDPTSKRRQKQTFSSSYGGAPKAKECPARPPLISIGPSGIGGPYQREIDVKG